jgi:hypothetical protein
MTAKLNLGTIFAALVLFLFPWLDIQCSGNNLATQSGLQTVYGGVSLSEQFQGMANEQKSDKDSSSMAIFAGLALVATIIAFVVALGEFRSGLSVSQSRAGGLCLIALALILVQMLLKFPVEQELLEEMKKSGSSGDPFGGMAAAVFSIRYTPWFWLELVALGIPAAFAVNRYLDKMKKVS